MAEERSFEEEYDREEALDIRSPEQSLQSFRTMWETLHQSGAYDSLMSLGSELHQGKEHLAIAFHRQLHVENGDAIKKYIGEHLPRMRSLLTFPLQQNRNGIDIAFGPSLNIYLIKRPLEITAINRTDKVTIGDSVVISSDPTGVLRIWGERTKVEQDGLAHTEERLPFLPKMFTRSEQSDRDAIRVAILGAHFSDPKAKVPILLK